jgi:hypothetical protein
MKLSNQKYLCDAYYIGKGKIVFAKDLSDADRYLTIKHAKSANNVVGRDHLKALYDEAFSVGCFGGKYTAETVDDVLSMVKNAKFTMVPLVKEVYGGKRGWGVIHMVKYDFIRKIAASMGIESELYSLAPEKFLIRIQKLFVKMELIANADVSLVEKSPFEGLIYAKADYMEKAGLVYGTKTSGVLKGLIVPAPDTMSFKGDLLISMDENKIKLPDFKLGKLIFVDRDQDPAKRFSKNLIGVSGKAGRLPVKAFDLHAMLNRPVRADLADIKVFYETGVISDKLFDMLFSYVDKTGTRKYTRSGLMLKSGIDRKDPKVVADVNTAIWTCVHARITGKIAGIYGVAMPLGLLPKGIKIKKGYITRYPWIFPVLAEYAVHEHCIFVDESVMKLFGGDYDGDLVAVYHKRTLDLPYSWAKDKVRLQEWMKMPEKETGEARSLEATLAYQLEQYAECGKAYNNAKIVVDCARLAGWSNDDVSRLDCLLMSNEVQPFINGLKYKGGNKAPSSFDLAKKYMVPITSIVRVTKFFNAVRSSKSGITEVIKAAKDLNPDANSKSYYERVVALFSTWTI